MIRKGSRIPRKILKSAREVHFLTKGGRPIYESPAAVFAASKVWLDTNVTTTATTVHDATGHWFELEIILPDYFAGNAHDGWSGVILAGTPPLTLGIYWSENLTSWLGAGNGWIDAPGKPPVNLGNGRKKWFARYATKPIRWKAVMIDLLATSDRYGKSITAVKALGATVALPNYPYDMPSEAAQLQGDLRAAGYTGATVTSVSAPLVATARNHTDAGDFALYVTMSGTDVTAVSTADTAISLPAYPYAMPSQQAALQADLRAAGQSGAVVMLHADEWAVLLPDRQATGSNREFKLTITPGDPFPYWDSLGAYKGLNPADVVDGTFGNLRAPSGAPLAEADKAFARMGFINF